MERRGLRAIALTTDSSVMTSLTNDFGYDEIFSRQVEALGKRGDIALAISTSGNSPNVIKAIFAAHDQGLKVIGLSGREGGGMRSLCDHLIVIPSPDTPRIQEGHALVYHILCGLVEQIICTK
jgi:D-sedoheptulose 7-phosphate isomerase